MTVGKGAVVKDSIVMKGTSIGDGTVVDKAIIAEDVAIGANAEIGVGEYAPSKYDPKVYQFDLVTIGERSVIPDGVKIGKKYRCFRSDRECGLPDGALESGDYIIKAGGVQ